VTSDAAVEVSGSALRCFVIGPIGDKFAEAGSEKRELWENSIRIMEEVIEPACREFGIAPIRSDLISEPGEIPEQVFELLRDSEIVIADVTGGNPNVMYELGMRHTRSHCTIQIGEYETLPFDITVIRTIQFRRTHTGLIDAREELKAALRECLAGNHRSVTATRLWTGTDLGDESTTDAPDTPPGSEDDGDLFLERLAQMEEALPRLGATIDEISGLTERLGEIMSKGQENLQRLQNAGNDSATARLQVAAATGSDLGSLADEFESTVAEYEQLLIQVDRGLIAMAEAIEEDPARVDELGELPANITEAAAAVQGAIDSSDETAALVGQLARIARPLKRPAERYAAAMRRFGKASALFPAWDARFQSVVASASHNTSPPA
jgi:hypothetical protein